MALPPINGTPTQAPPAAPARAAAQRAFFDAALGRAQAAAATQTPTEVQARPQPAQAQVQASASPRPAPASRPTVAFDPKTQPFDPDARPGSLVNIRV